MTQTYVHKWPSREEWAYSRQHPYWDTPKPAVRLRISTGHRLSDYATSEEVSAAITGLQNLWQQHGRRLRELNRTGLAPWRRESAADYGGRYRAMSPEEQGIAEDLEELKCWRRFIRRIIASLREGTIPPHHEWAHAGEAAIALIAPFKQRYEAAEKAAEGEWERERLLPVDDAAWEKELERRRKYEEFLSNPESRFVHRDFLSGA